MQAWFPSGFMLLQQWFQQWSFVVMTCARCKRCPVLRMAGFRKLQQTSCITQKVFIALEVAHTCHAFSHKTPRWWVARPRVLKRSATIFMQMRCIHFCYEQHGIRIRTLPPVLYAYIPYRKIIHIHRSGPPCSFSLCSFPCVPILGVMLVR